MKPLSKILLAAAVLAITFASTGCVTAEAAQEKYVYECTGKYAKVYHLKRNCKGLNKCHGSIRKVKLSETKRQPCKICAQ